MSVLYVSLMALVNRQTDTTKEILDDVDYQVDKRPDAQQASYGLGSQSFGGVNGAAFWNKVRGW